MVLHRDGICTDLFFLSIPNSILGSSTSPFLSLLYGMHKLPSYLLARNWAFESFFLVHFFLSFLFLLCYNDKPR